VRTELTVLCHACDVRLSVRAQRCPYCAAWTSPAVTATAPQERRRHWTNHAGRWMRRVAALLLLLVAFVYVVGIPLALVGTWFTDKPFLTVFFVSMGVAGASLIVVLAVMALAVVAPFVWLALLPFAYLRGTLARPTHAVSPRAVPPPRRRSLGHHMVRFAELVNRRTGKDGSSTVAWALGAIYVALVVAALVTWARDLEGLEGGWGLCGIVLIVTMMVGLGTSFFGATVQSLAKWLVSPPGLELPAEEQPEKVTELLVELRRGDRVEGVVHAREHLLDAPLHGDPCVAVRVRGSAGGRRVDDVLAAPMVIDTDEGPVVLVGEDLVVALDRFETRGTSLKDDRWLAPRGLVANDVVLEEAQLKPGTRVVVYGRAERALRTDGGYRGVQRERIVALHDDAGPILIEPLAAPES
jgi:hypothetical protein